MTSKSVLNLIWVNKNRIQIFVALFVVLFIGLGVVGSLGYAKIQDLEYSIVSLESDVASLESKVSSLDYDIMTLKRQFGFRIDDLESEVNKLSRTLDSVCSFLNIYFYC